MNKRRTVGLQLEYLESRELLAGNVMASVVDGKLVVEGDNVANNIRITQMGTAYFVEGVDGTTVNGANAPFSTGPTAEVLDICVNLNNGNDTVSLEQLTTGDVTVNSGNGNDEVRVTGGMISGDVDIDTDNGKDRVILEGGAKIDGDVNIDTGNGSDTVIGAAGDSGTIDIGGNLDVGMGNGADMLDLTGVNVEGDANLDGGNGKDKLTGPASVGGAFNPKNFE